MSGRRTKCVKCPHLCLLSHGDRGRCRNRVNIGGTLYTLAYGNPCSVHIDPVEKKPLFHYLPGTPILSLSTAGCVLSCKNCQNWQISQSRPEDTRNTELFPADAVALAQREGTPSIAYTYGEPIAFYDYWHDTSVAAHAAGIRNVWVTSGFINPEPLKRTAPYIDAANIDIKGFDDRRHAELNGGPLQPVLDTLKLSKRLGLWLEVTCLLVPEWTDDIAEIDRMCGWIARELGTSCPVHFSRFTPQYQLTHLPPTPLSTLLEARKAARENGIEHVYIGNVAGAGYQDTYCPTCGTLCIARRGYEVVENRLEGGRCPTCGTAIPGVWA
ncbi:AmmeMemoRadiSam system radical SAM enzyme [Candidatus Woesearchaeota archaeon]|nr:AmmeMemoRadiSam system radical SAM enzyme [Candidatus Woesearchaeota archaeon]